MSFKSIDASDLLQRARLMQSQREGIRTPLRPLSKRACCFHMSLAAPDPIWHALLYYDSGCLINSLAVHMMDCSKFTNGLLNHVAST